MNRNRLGAAALGLAGIMFILYPALRPWPDESTVSGATASMGSAYWMVSHFFAMIGFILAPLGLLALRATPAAVTTWIGAGLVLPYYGAEDFGLHAAAGKGVPDLLGYAEAVRYNPLAVTIFGAGLILIGVGGILAAVAVWRSTATATARVGATAYAAGMALFLPQFFTPAGVRIAHGVVLGIGALLWAYTMNQRDVSPTVLERGTERAGIMAG